MTQAPAGLPKFKQLATVLRERIEKGVYEPGSQMPTELDIENDSGLMQILGTTFSRTTVRLAMKELISGGLVYVDHGRGTFVRRVARVSIHPQQELRPHPVDHPRDAFMQQLVDEQQAGEQRIHVAMVPAPPHIAAKLELEPGEEIVARTREIIVEGEFVRTIDSYYRREDVEGSAILDPADIPRGTNRVLEELGHAQVRRTNELIARHPTPDEVHRLHLPPATPVLVLTVTGYNDQDRPVRCTENLLRGDRNTVVYEF